MDGQYRPTPEQTLQPSQSSAPLQLAASSWHNITAWAFNISRHAPLLEEILLAGPRFLTRLGIHTASPTDGDLRQLTSDSDRQFPPVANGAQMRNILQPHDVIIDDLRFIGRDEDAYATNQAVKLSLDRARGLGSVFTYATSKWAISCIAMAIILNRTYIFATTRRRLRLRWHTRLLLRFLPILLLGLQTIRLLQSIQCQTSPDFSSLRWGDSEKTSELAFAHPISFLNKLSSALLFGATDRRSCEAVNMIPLVTGTEPQQLRGSLSMLWPTFGVLCLSHFIETLSSAVQGRPILAETSMTLFEQSLAFAEAETAIHHRLGWDTFSKQPQAFHLSTPNLAARMSITRSAVLGKVNTPAEVLFIAFLSSVTHLSSHILGVFDAQSRYRLINTGCWGVCFMCTIILSAFHFEPGNTSAQSLLRFPTICIIGFVPHVLILAGITVCAVIYVLSLGLSALEPTSHAESASLSIRQRFEYAHSNMQANVSLAEIRITSEMDFYTALLRTGFAAITMASEAVYLNEERRVNVQRHTWLEEARLNEIEELQRSVSSVGYQNTRYDEIGAIGLVPIKNGAKSASCGYGRERAAQSLIKGRGERAVRGGSGASEKSSRWFMVADFMLSLSRLIVRTVALTALHVLGKSPIRYRPSWLLWLAHRENLTVEKEAASGHENMSLSQNGLSTPDKGFISCLEGADIEKEFRHLRSSQDEDQLDAELYMYWVSGGWWGSNDSSGNYVPEGYDESWDATSLVSGSSVATDSDDPDGGWITEDADRKSPTTVSTQSGRESSPLTDAILDPAHLARLLQPVAMEEREEALRLSAHLQSDRTITRSAFRRREQLRRSRVLIRPGHLQNQQSFFQDGSRALTSEDEETMLEQILLSQRGARNTSTMQSREPLVDGSRDEEVDNFPCVVCHTSKRTIIVWPCRCLSLCDECRISLAMNNFDKCVCCRRDVLSFSRIYVP